MRFYALRIVCARCGAAFLVGGSTGNDLSRWRRLNVECRGCHAEIPAAQGRTVDLLNATAQMEVEAPELVSTLA